jgi:hypothetical protein
MAEVRSIVSFDEGFHSGVVMGLKQGVAHLRGKYDAAADILELLIEEHEGKYETVYEEGKRTR